MPGLHRAGSSLQVYHTDGLGSVRAISDGLGSVIEAYRTNEFGVSYEQRGKGAQPFGYTVEEREETGLVFLRARYYDPAIGRFISVEPARVRQRGSLPQPLPTAMSASPALDRVLGVGVLLAAGGVLEEHAAGDEFPHRRF